MAPGFVVAEAAHREWRPLRQFGKKLDHLPRLGLGHLGAIAAEKGCRRQLGFEKGRKQCLAGREDRQPDIQEIALSVFGFGHTARRTPNGSDSEPFSGLTRGTKLDGPKLQGHGIGLSCCYGWRFVAQVRQSVNYATVPRSEGLEQSKP